MIRKLLLLFIVSWASPSEAFGQGVPVFRAVEIDSKVEIGYGVTIGDVDGDKKPDILLADKNSIVWYQNPSWKKHTITEKLTVLDHVAIAAMDIDRDGRVEVAAGAGWNPSDTTGSGSVHYLSAQPDRTQRWLPFELPHEPTVHRMRWVKNARGGFELIVVPLHGRGNKGGEGAGVKILAYKTPANPRGSWTTEVLDDSLHMTHNFDPVQWDNDPADELLIAAREGVFLLDRGEGRSKLTKLAGNEGGGAGEVRRGRLPGGKRFFATIEPMHGDHLVTYTAPGGDEKKLWQRSVVDASLKEGHALGCGDLIGSGFDQIVVGWRSKNSEDKVGILLFTPLDREGKSWRRTVVDDNTMACEDLSLADLDGDGRLDIVASGRATKNLKVYFNQGTR